MISEAVLIRFVGSIMSSAITPLLDHPQISNLMLKMYMSKHEGVFDI